MRYPKPKFKCGDRVMFANKCQTTEYGMLVQAVNVSMFGVLVKVNEKWWSEGCFVFHHEWQEKSMEKVGG